MKGNGLYKTRKFKDPLYVGDPINAVRIFSEKQVDEIVLLDIDASKTSTEPNNTLIEKISSECFVPLTYGGGISSIDQMRQIYRIGVEKISVNSSLFSQQDMVREAVKTFGSQSVVASIDIRKKISGLWAYTHGGTKRVRMSISTIIEYLNKLNIGEVILNSIDRDGTLNGYDKKLTQLFADKLNIPVTTCGGCGSLEHVLEVVRSGASAACAGSLFLFKGSRNSVLINYPSQESLKDRIFLQL